MKKIPSIMIVVWGNSGIMYTILEFMQATRGLRQ